MIKAIKYVLGAVIGLGLLGALLKSCEGIEVDKPSYEIIKNIDIARTQKGVKPEFYLVLVDSAYLDSIENVVMPKIVSDYGDDDPKTFVLYAKKPDVSKIKAGSRNDLLQLAKPGSLGWFFTFSGSEGAFQSAENYTN
ncbi:MAG: hypothetical protein AAF741_18790 [Bacteroidota bacterium]